MKFVITTVAALSIATVAAVAAHVDPVVLGTPQSTEAGRTSAQPAQLILAQRYRYRRKCQEDLGYGRTGTYGCG